MVFKMDNEFRRFSDVTATTVSLREWLQSITSMQMSTLSADSLPFQAIDKR